MSMPMISLEGRLAALENRVARLETSGRKYDPDPHAATPDVLLIMDRFEGDACPRQIVDDLPDWFPETTNGDAMIVARILRENGWKKDGHIRHGRYRGCARYVRVTS